MFVGHAEKRVKITDFLLCLESKTEPSVAKKQNYMGGGHHTEKFVLEGGHRTYLFDELDKRGGDTAQHWKNKSRSRVGGWVGQIWFYKPLWLSSENSLDSESKFEQSVAILGYNMEYQTIFMGDIWHVTRASHETSFCLLRIATNFCFRVFNKTPCIQLSRHNEKLWSIQGRHEKRRWSCQRKFTRIATIFFFNITAFFAHDQVVIRGNNIFVEILSLKKIIYEFYLLRKNNYKC